MNLHIKYCKSKEKIIKINKQIKIDGDKISGIYIPIILPSNNFIICLKNILDKKIVSFIHYQISYNFKKFDKILFMNYSYNFITYRKRGFNKKLRLFLEDICKKKKIKVIVSLPFPEFESRIVIIKLYYFVFILFIFIK